MYENFAYIYDSLMYDINYKSWADYIEKIFKKYGQEPKLLLDLGCGTGSLCIELARRGYDMTGVDLSSDMLSCAREKAANVNADILFLNQDMQEFELYGTVDSILCMMDSLNYVTNLDGVTKTMKLVRNYLNPGGLFIFDINTRYKFEKVLDGNVFYDVGEDVSYIWENDFSAEDKICGFDITFFVREGEMFRKYDEYHEERAYSEEEIMEAIGESGLTYVDTFHEFTFNKPKINSERIFFVCRK